VLIIPAIDLKEGKCVRLRQGRMEDNTVFSDNPLKMVEKWVTAGAERLHVIDLDGALAGRPRNSDIIHNIVEAFPGLTIQVGGGIRSEDTVQEYLDAGVSYVIIGTKAVSEPHFVNDLCLSFPGHVIVGLDARDGKVAIDGWSKLSNHDVVDLAQHFERDGVDAIIYTDISRDGMLTGVNIESTVNLARSIRVPVIASGGVSSMKDLTALAKTEEEGVVGVIIGRALYEGEIDLAEALKSFGTKK
jgi:phosphoribosylformimino-5-aminoimidazole carboxamide ribotide isomerase